VVVIAANLVAGTTLSAGAVQNDTGSDQARAAMAAEMEGSLRHSAGVQPGREHPSPVPVYARPRHAQIVMITAVAAAAT